MPRKECGMGAISSELWRDELAGRVDYGRNTFSIIDLAVNNYVQIIGETD